MYSDAEDHLANLDHCGGRELRRAYLNLLLAATRTGYEVSARTKGEVRELQIRDADNCQPFAVIVNQSTLSFTLRRPALADRPELVAAARMRFGDRVAADPDSTSEVRIRITTEDHADRIAEWLFNGNPTGNVTPGYGGRISA